MSRRINATLSSYAYKEGDTVSIKKTKSLGLVIYRFRNKNKVKVYQIVGNRWSDFFYESELTSTPLRVFGEVKITEIKFDDLHEGTKFEKTIFYKPSKVFRDLFKEMTFGKIPNV